jgi:inosine/xanthosine triphosphatase
MGSCSKNNKLARGKGLTNMIKVLIVSKNPVKIQASREAFSYFYENLSFDWLEIDDYSRNVNHFKIQPIGEEETYRASRNRVKWARTQHSLFDYYVGIEGGIASGSHEKPRIIVYCTVGSHSLITTVRGCEIPLPPQWYDQLLNKTQEELGDLVTEVSGISNIKQKQGVVGFFTKNVVKRVDIIKQGVIMALIPFLHPKLF